MVARLGVYLGDQTNNEAEYQGALAVLRHALSMRCPRIFLYGDSKLVVSQLNGVWMCKTDHLAPYYEQGLACVILNCLGMRAALIWCMCIASLTSMLTPSPMPR